MIIVPVRADWRTQLAIISGSNKGYNITHFFKPIRILIIKDLTCLWRKENLQSIL
jgi:hypothetical protein